MNSTKKSDYALVRKRFRFSAAHYLPDYPGACSRVHGHTYEVEITCWGEVGEDGMVVDFGDLKYAFEERVHKLFDHRWMNDVIEVPTTENVARYIFDALEEEFGAKLYTVILREGPDQEAQVFVGGLTSLD